MTETGFAQLHVIVTGHVQGVGFRAFVQDQAYRIGLTGWVRNRWDGSVEVLAEGEKYKLETLLQALYRGPRLGTVSGLEAQWGEYSGEFHDFRVRQTSG